jgi:hypothetical protein
VSGVRCELGKRQSWRGSSVSVQRKQHGRYALFQMSSTSPQFPGWCPAFRPESPATIWSELRKAAR